MHAESQAQRLIRCAFYAAVTNPRSPQRALEEDQRATVQAGGESKSTAIEPSHDACLIPHQLSEKGLQCGVHGASGAWSITEEGQNLGLKLKPARKT